MPDWHVFRMMLHQLLNKMSEPGSETSLNSEYQCNACCQTGVHAAKNSYVMGLGLRPDATISSNNSSEVGQESPLQEIIASL
mmetsp:Transcript_86435/g.234408  ORF Transcript_86435/g.234408 Transcript_86435/m.234408 type:complete len:82 (-) Transcript_86435:899-1144(-)